MKRLLCLIGIHRWDRASYGVGPMSFWRSARCTRCPAVKTNVTGTYRDFSL
jgi:hypothetical protein